MFYTIEFILFVSAKLLWRMVQ